MRKFISTIFMLTLYNSVFSQINTWVQTTDVGLRTNTVPIDRTNPIRFTIGNKMYWGIGLASDSSLLHDFWEYNMTTNVWTQKANCPAIPGRRWLNYSIQNRSLGSFSLGTKGYVKDSASFYEYDPSTNIWTPKANVAPNWYVKNAFAMGGEGYVLTDTGMFAYNASTNSWAYRIAPPTYCGPDLCSYIKSDTIALIRYTSHPVYIGEAYSAYNRITNTWQNVDAPISYITFSLPFDIFFSIDQSRYSLGKGGVQLAKDTIFAFSSGSWNLRVTTRPNVPRRYGYGAWGAWGVGQNGSGYVGGIEVDSMTSVIKDNSQYYRYDTSTNSWSTLGALKPLKGRTNCVSFAIGSKIFLGNGKRFWRYDTLSAEWSRIAEIPFNLGGKPVAFVVNGFGFVGSGNTNQFWKYDTAANTWTAIAPFPGIQVTDAVAFGIGNYGYVGTGYDGTNHRKQFYSYYPATNTWATRADFAGGKRSKAACFVLGGKAYVGTGIDSAGGHQDIWEYNPIGNVWTAKANFGGGYISAATGFSTPSRGFIATGGTDQMYAYDNISDIWTPCSSFVGGSRINSTGVGIGNTIYFGTGIDYSTTLTKNDFWKYRYCPLPNAGVITGSSIVCEGGSITLADTVTGGVWSSSSSTIATVSATGVVTGVSAGSVVITYAVTNTCGDSAVTKNITVNPLPLAGSISGSDSLCLGDTTSLLSTIGGGFWSSSDITIASVTTSGVVIGISSGTASISYSISNSCGTDNAIHPIFVKPSSICSTKVSWIESQEYTIYPNPTKSTVNIDATANIFIELFDIAGTKLFAKENAKVIDFSPFATGVYILKVFDINHTFLRVEKIIKMP